MSETPQGRPFAGDADTTTDRHGNGRVGARDDPDLDERLRAVERALTDEDVAPADLSDAAAREQRLDRLETTVEDLEGRLAEAEAGVEAVRGYVGSVRAVNREVERRADAALAATDAGQGGGSGAGEVDLPTDGTPDEERHIPGGDGETSVRERLERLL